jgi:hypothetical protein
MMRFGAFFQKNYSKFTLFFLAISLIFSAFAKPKWTRNEALTFDPLGYYSYLPATFIYHDLKTCAWQDSIQKKYGVWVGEFLKIPPMHPENRIIKYSSGLALMEMPFFFAAHFLAKPLGFEADGFSKPYQIAISFGGIFMAILGLFYSRKALLRYFSEKTTALALFLIGLGTNFYHYARYDYAHTHVWLFAILAMLVWATIRFYEKPTFFLAAAIGATVGIATLTRPTELVCLMIPLFWGMDFSKKALQNRLFFFKNNWKRIVVAALVAAAILFLQGIYWKILSGDWFYYSYENERFRFAHPHWKDCLISYRKGWLVYTPMMIFALAGVYFLGKNRSILVIAVFLHTLFNMWCVFSWDCWWYGGSFGQRAMVESYAILIFPLAAFLQFALNFEWKRLIFWPIAVFLVLLNFFQSWQGELTGLNLDFDNNPKAYYWRMFLNFHPQKSDMKLLDAPDDYSSTSVRAQVKNLIQKDVMQTLDSVFIDKNVKSSGKSAIFCDGSHEFVVLGDFRVTPKIGWVRFRANYFIDEKEWNTQNTPILTFDATDKNGKSLKWIVHRPARYLEIWKWQELYFDLKIENLAVESVRIALWQPHKNAKKMWLRDLEMEEFDGKRWRMFE